MSDVVIQAAIAAIVTMVIAYFQMRTKNAVVAAAVEAKDTAVKAEAKTEAVKITLEQATVATDAKLVGLEKVAKDTHTLVNSNMGVQLKLNAAVTKRLADITNNREDIAAANLAATMYAEHLAKQAKVDSDNA